jgi:hypothetical protein
MVFFGFVVVSPLYLPFIEFRMKYLSVLFILFLFGCGGNLSDEQRRKIKEGLELQKIVKVSEAEIMSDALVKGQQVFEILEKNNFDVNIDSLSENQKVLIRFIPPGVTNARLVEQELIDAYVNGIVTNDHPENLQKIWISDQKEDYDSLLYTRPQIIIREDGVEELKGIWSIYISRKDVVLNISKQK